MFDLITLIKQTMVCMNKKHNTLKLFNAITISAHKNMTIF